MTMQWASSATTKTLEVFRSLVGRWKIHRSLGSEGTAAGLAVFTPSRETDRILKYREDLEVTLKDGETKGMTAYQEYVYEYDERRDQIVTKFVDGRLFFELNFEAEGQVAKGVHLCGDDTYRGTYDFGGEKEGSFVLRVEVEGPRKGHTILTRFTKDEEAK